MIKANPINPKTPAYVVSPPIKTGLVVGFGDVGERVTRLLTPEYSVTALIRNPQRAKTAGLCGANHLAGDLSKLETLTALGEQSNQFDAIFHFAPPPGSGLEDTHTRNLLVTLTKGLTATPTVHLKQFIYISTTGVYGDCGGDIINENRPLNPQTDRARRRVDAEQCLQAWAALHQVRLIILRAPGIYAIERLPLERIRSGTPAMIANEDSHTNHIHADDLAAACLAACTKAATLNSNQILNVVDDSDLKVGDFLDLLADHFQLTRPPRVSRAELQTRVNPPIASFLNESRRIQNTRMKAVLNLKLRYPTVQDFLTKTPRWSAETAAAAKFVTPGQPTG